ncbi:hypothetical protein PHMEG_00033274 [Phytophthora megakarya]|uniref:Uncharacterized protein n=1 Tax=Phytophthora megakarya TaxID=4795 RepID=A0A225UTB8_9STRA|nr:hypothetical protein PHMEG_00033274 [Phytophthora megakarya]
MNKGAEAQSLFRLASLKSALLGSRASNRSNSVSTDEIPVYWASTSELSVFGVNVINNAGCLYVVWKAKTLCLHWFRSALLPQTDREVISTDFRNRCASESSAGIHGRQPCRRRSFASRARPNSSPVKLSYPSKALGYR